MSNGLPAGYYKAKAILNSEQMGRSKNDGVQIAITMEIMDGEFAGEQVITILQYSGGGKEVSYERLKALGWNMQFSPDGNFLGIDANTVSLEARLESWVTPNGETKEQMRYEIKTGGRFKFKEELNDAEKRAFQKEMLDMVKMMEGGGPRPSSSGKGNGGKTGYDADWENKGGGQQQRAPKVDL